jgi:hypothetical protein
MGNGVLVALDSVVDAVGCATEIQKTTTERGMSLPARNRILLRIGVSLGDSRSSMAMFTVIVST